MEINNKSQNVGLIYQQLSNEKNQLSSVDKKDKSTFEKNDTVDDSNNKNTQRDEESKKIENMIDFHAKRILDMSEKEREKLDKHFRKSLVQNSEGMWENPNDKGDWVLIWWKKEL